MHSSFTFNPNAHRSQSNYNKQQPVYNIGASPAFAQTLVTHRHPPNLFLNHQAFTRSFASVVSCDGHRGNHQNMSNVNANNSSNNSGILGSFLKHFNKPTTAHYHHPSPQQAQHKEFEDFTHMPSVNNQYTHNPYLNQQPPTHINMSFPEQLKQSVNNTASYAAATTNFMASFFGVHQQRQAPTKPRKPWFNRGYRCRGGRWGSKNQFNPKFHQHDVNVPKNVHEKERSSLERDIQDDNCDFVQVVEDKEMKSSSNNPNETAKWSCYSKRTDDPPFTICSLEDFPAITATVKRKTAVDKKQLPPNADEGFVVVPTEASISTPSFTPKRISLCEKFIKSPTKVFPKVQPIALKPCLKAPRRRPSESSDDFIVFISGDDSDDDEEEDDRCSDVESETDSDDSDDDIFEEDEETSDEEEEVDECDNKRCETPERQVDSGVEERKVSCASSKSPNHELSLI